MRPSTAAVVGAVAGAALMVGTPALPGGRGGVVAVDARFTPSEEQGGPRLTWAEGGDIWLSDGAGPERRRLTTDGDRRVQSTPRFHGRDRVTFVEDRTEAWAGSTVREVDLDGGGIRDLAELTGAVLDHDWSPDGKTLALYVLAGEANHLRGELHVHTGGRTRLVREFGPVPDGGGFVNYDDTTVQWSGDGERLVVVDTRLRRGDETTIFVLRPDGSEARVPLLGSWARWSADARTLYCLCATTKAGDEGGWQAFDTRKGTGRPLPIAEGSRPVLSPDGRHLAFDDGDAGPSIHVLDLVAGGRPRLLAGSAIAPLWLDAEHLAVTDTRPCPHSPEECDAGGHGAQFVAQGTASIISLVTGERRAVPLPGTEGADAYAPRAW